LKLSIKKRENATRNSISSLVGWVSVIATPNTHSTIKYLICKKQKSRRSVFIYEKGFNCCVRSFGFGEWRFGLGYQLYKANNKIDYQRIVLEGHQAAELSADEAKKLFEMRAAKPAPTNDELLIGTRVGVIATDAEINAIEAIRKQGQQQ